MWRAITQRHAGARHHQRLHIICTSRIECCHHARSAAATDERTVHQQQNLRRLISVSDLVLFAIRLLRRLLHGRGGLATLATTLATTLGGSSTGHLPNHLSRLVERCGVPPRVERQPPLHPLLLSLVPQHHGELGLLAGTTLQQLLLGGGEVLLVHHPGVVLPGERRAVAGRRELIHGALDEEVGEVDGGRRVGGGGGGRDARPAGEVRAQVGAGGERRALQPAAVEVVGDEAAVGNGTVTVDPAVGVGEGLLRHLEDELVG
mmetsp:Transcript_24810/g.61126  ORF Transcript_24810/g.61126 Transcript_24810/m.61126 type:complete len:262 (+) Transcript_24810:1433-2218(+)